MNKLKINRETIRNLSSEDLQVVVGGMPRIIPASDTDACGGGGGGGGTALSCKTCDNITVTGCLC